MGDGACCHYCDRYKCICKWGITKKDQVACAEKGHQCSCKDGDGWRCFCGVQRYDENEIGVGQVEFQI